VSFLAAESGVPRVIGLVGGVGSGKSRVAEEFARRGAKIISGDAAGHAALRQPDIRERIAARWPTVLENGEVSRRALGQIVFADPAEMRALEALVHPWIGQQLRHQVGQARSDPTVPLIVVDAAVLFEAGWNDLCDKVIFVEAPLEVRRQRVAATRGWSADELARREAAQLPLTAKAARADHVLDNSGNPDQLTRRVDELVREWKLTLATRAGN
jgi:dephospho-CoA kinase